MKMKKVRLNKRDPQARTLTLRVPSDLIKGLTEIKVDFKSETSVDVSITQLIVASIREYVKSRRKF